MFLKPEHSSRFMYLTYDVNLNDNNCVPIVQMRPAHSALYRGVITLTISIRTNYDVHYFNDFKLRMYLQRLL